jgi:hypothetical protein
MTAPDDRSALAARFLAEARQRPVDGLPPSMLMRECAELRRFLGQVLGVLAEQQARQQDDARRLADIRQLLGGFDWEYHDRQLALEAIERIVSGGQL